MRIVSPLIMSPDPPCHPDVWRPRCHANLIWQRAIEKAEFALTWRHSHGRNASHLKARCVLRMADGVWGVRPRATGSAHQAIIERRCLKIVKVKAGHGDAARVSIRWFAGKSSTCLQLLLQRSEHTVARNDLGDRGVGL